MGGSLLSCLHPLSYHRTGAGSCHSLHISSKPTAFGTSPARRHLALPLPAADAPQHPPDNAVGGPSWSLYINSDSRAARHGSLTHHWTRNGLEAPPRSAGRRPFAGPHAAVAGGARDGRSAGALVAELVELTPEEPWRRCGGCWATSLALGMSRGPRPRAAGPLGIRRTVRPAGMSVASQRGSRLTINPCTSSAPAEGPADRLAPPPTCERYRAPNPGRHAEAAYATARPFNAGRPSTAVATDADVSRCRPS